MIQAAVRFTQYAHGGGCACKIPPGELEEAVARLVPESQGAGMTVLPADYERLMIGRAGLVGAR